MTLQATALVHEAYVRLVEGGCEDWNSPGHFFRAAAEAMRRILVENARRKAISVISGSGDIIIGADTIGVCNGNLLGKPKDLEDARRMLLLQQDHPCRVITGMAVHDLRKGKTIHGYEVSVVEMDGGRNGVEEYLSTGQWKGKAGSFGIQDRGSIGARVVIGEEDNVIGMPMTLLRRLLSLTGFEYPDRTPS